MRMVNAAVAAQWRHRRSARGAAITIRAVATLPRDSLVERRPIGKTLCGFGKCGMFDASVD